MAFDLFSSIADLAKGVLDRVIPDPAQRAAAQLKLLELQQNGELAKLAADTDITKAQLEINKVEAASPLTFISGARPAAIWVCVGGLSIQLVLGPILEWATILAGHPVKAPQLDVGTLLAVLIPLLGLGTLRTVDKINGSASK